MGDGETNADAVLHLEWVGGNCPVQAEGTIGGRAVYFRARGDSWSLLIGDDWRTERPYGDMYEAGWMSNEEALANIVVAAIDRRRGRPGRDETPTSTDAVIDAQMRRLMRESRETMARLGKS